MELCWSSRLEASIPRSKLSPTPIFLSRAVRIGIDALKRFPELMICLAEAFPRFDIGLERRLWNVRSHVSFWGRNGLDMLSLSLVAHDPERSLTVYRGIRAWYRRLGWMGMTPLGGSYGNRHPAAGFHCLD